MKEKRKNIDSEELKAISLSAAEAAKGRYDAKVQEYSDKIRQKLMQGEFKTEDDGTLSVGMGMYPNYKFRESVKVNLLSDFSYVTDEEGFWRTYWKIKP